MKIHLTKVGEIKTVNRFAIIPVKLSNGNTVWLEWYRIDKKLISYRCGLVSDGDYFDTLKMYQ